MELKETISCYIEFETPGKETIINNSLPSYTFLDSINNKISNVLLNVQLFCDGLLKFKCSKTIPINLLKWTKWLTSLA